MTITTRLEIDTGQAGQRKSLRAVRLIHGVYVNMSPRMAVMVVGKVSSGLLQPVCRTFQVLMLAMTRSIL